MQAPASPGLRATLGAGFPTELPEAAARGWRAFIPPQPQCPARPPPYFT